MEPAHPSVVELQTRLAEAEETLRAIRHGEVDALLIVDDAGERVYTLRGADTPYRVLVERMQEGAATLTSLGSIVYCNQRFADLVKTPLQHAIGVSIDQFIQQSDRLVLRGMVVNGFGKLQTRLLHGGVPALEVQISVSSVVLDEVEHRCLIVSDISSLMRTKRESRSKDEFLAMLAHELRNPLGAIQGAVQALGTTGVLNPTAIRASGIIQRQVLHMAHLVDDLLDVGRVVTGKIVLNRRDVDFAECVRASVSALTAGQHLEERVTVEAESVWVHGDSVRLEQIIGNLVSNALKFSAIGSRVHVSVGREGGDAILRVADQGIGIEADLLPRIFDLFVQASDTIDRSQGGLGIGLTLVRRLVELHDGEIHVVSEGTGHGAVFTVCIPAIARVETVNPANGSHVPVQAKRVFLVDDNADSREMYRVVLKSLGHIVYEAEDGTQAMDLLASARPDVAFIDIGLPEMDGYELARRIRATPQGRDITLVALTGYGFPEDRQRAREAGFDRHLVKPVDPSALQLELDRATTENRRRQLG
jgi:signal transduction histidine kinase/ActR/RegA family two-component response regulator